MIDVEKDASDIEEMAAAAHNLRERGINPAVHIASGTANSIRAVLEILTSTERKTFFVVMATEIEMMMAAEDKRVEGSILKPN
jgi:DNA-binding transcriptional regulator LsrR (DeoR family)